MGTILRKLLGIGMVNAGLVGILNSGCGSDYICPITGNDYLLCSEVITEGECAPEYYDPVACGDNGKAYNNPCEACKDPEVSSYTFGGECADDFP